MRTLAQGITETLREWILHGRLKPHQKLEEVPLAAQLNASRTPVRAALAALASEGLLSHQPKRGYIVKEFDLNMIAAAYEVRSVLEGLACRKAAQLGLTGGQDLKLKKLLATGDQILGKGYLDVADHEPYQQINVEIHDILLTAACNPWASRFVGQAFNIPFVSDRIMLWGDHPIIFRSHGDHHRIIEAVIARDCVRAEELMREHVYYAGLILRRNFERLQNSVPFNTEEQRLPLS